MAVTNGYTPTLVQLQGAALGPFASVWTCQEVGDVRAFLKLGDGLEPALLSPGVDYAVTGAQPLAAGVAVTLSVALLPASGAWPAGATLTLKRVTPTGQPQTFADAQAFIPSSAEAALDTLARQIQEARAESGVEALDPVKLNAAVMSAVLLIIQPLASAAIAQAIAAYGLLQADVGTGT